MKRRFFILVIALFTLFTLTSCSKKFKVTFDSNGGSSVETQEVKKGEYVKKPADPKKEGYTFSYWEKDGSKFNFGTAISENITLKAKWEENAPTSYTVTFDTAGGSTIAPVKVSANGKVQKPADPTRSGYDFVGWKLNGANYDFNTTVTANITLTAEWKAQSGVETVTVTFNTDGGNNITPVTLKKGDKLTLPATPTKTGYTFEGWTLNGEPFNQNQAINENITLVATWKQNSSGGIYQPLWKPAQQVGGWQGRNMKVVILVLPKSSYDPFDDGYSASDQRIRQQQEREVEKNYQIQIEYQDWDNSAPWGPDRVKYIKDKGPNGELQSKDQYIINIASSWIPTLVGANCLAELYDMSTQTGIFAEVGYEEVEPGLWDGTNHTYHQDMTNNQVTSSANKVYGYIQGNVHPDYFMYFNVELIEEMGMENPAELWFKGKWTWSTFESYANELQTKLAAKGSEYKALAMGYPEFLIGSVASTGGSIATPGDGMTPPMLNLTSTSTLNRFSAIQRLTTSNLYDGSRGVSDVATSFAAGQSVFHHGDLWFLGDTTRFGVCDFEIGCVPYPTADGQGGTTLTTSRKQNAILSNEQPLVDPETGDYISGLDLSSSSFQVPYGSTSCYSIIDTQNGKNGITNKILFAIMYDLYDGLGDDPDKVTLSAEESYRNWLITKFDNTLYADVIMSTEGRTYFELAELLSMSVGGGSHFGPDALWIVIPNICRKSDVSPATELNSIVGKYRDTMRSMGYLV